jgi:hypothetical protein
MNYGLLILVQLELILTIGGAMILFTDRGLDWMYKQGIWARASNLIKEKDKRRFDRYIYGSGFFVAGLITLTGSLLAFLSQWEFLRVAIVEFLSF